jgi:Site-specific recombinases, DNA invertase Pin homologs
MADKPKAAIYCRVASVSDFALSVQEQKLRTFTDKQGYKVIAIFIDNGANGLDFNRPAYLGLKQMIENGGIDAVLVKDISRIYVYN